MESRLKAASAIFNLRSSIFDLETTKGEQWRNYS